MSTVKVFLAVCLIAVFFQSSAAQEIEKDRLTVYGKVRVFAKTDRANISFEILGYGKSLKIAFDDAKAQMDTISQKLFAIGLTEEELSTTFFQNSENLGKKAFLSSKKDYRTKMTASITTRRLELLEPIIITLSECKIEGIDYIAFELVDYSELRLKALKEAVAKAKEKADMISEVLAIQYGDVIELEEIKIAEPERPWLRPPSGSRPNPFNASIYLDAEYYSHIYARRNDNPSIFAQEITFDSEVKLVLEILGNDKTDEIEENSASAQAVTGS
jgi:uncharacterized protein YggE